MKDEPTHRYLLEGEAAAYLRISPRNVRKLPIRVIRVGRRKMYDIRDLDRYAESCKVLQRLPASTAPSIRDLLAMDRPAKQRKEPPAAPQGRKQPDAGNRVEPGMSSRMLKRETKLAMDRRLEEARKKQER